MPDAGRTESGTDGRSTRWETHKARRRVDVLDAAIDAIEHEGPAVGLQRIADGAGLPRSVVYRHFADRADLDEQVRQRITTLLMAELEPALRPEGTMAQAIRRAVDAYLGWIEHHPRLHSFLGRGSDPAATSARPSAETRQAVTAKATELFAAALDGLDAPAELASALASGLVGFVDAAVNSWLADKDAAMSTAELAAFLSRSIWSVLDQNLRALDVELDPEMPLSACS